MTTIPKLIWNDACAAATLAAHAEDTRLPPERLRGLDCGFAWVVIKPARGAFVKWCRDNDKGETRSYSGGGFQIWYSQFDPTPTQSISVHVGAAKAFVGVLLRHGIPARWESRLD